MRHIIHINFSEHCDSMLTKIASYVMQNGGEKNLEYLHFFQIKKKSKASIDIYKVGIQENYLKPSLTSFNSVEEEYTSTLNPFEFCDSENKLISFFTNLFNSTININSNGIEYDLLYVFYVPIYQKDVSLLVKKVPSALQQSNKPVSVDIIGISADCAPLFSNEEENKKMYDLLPIYRINQKDEFLKIVEYKKEYISLFKHLYFFQNCQTSAVSLDLNLEVISKIFGDLSILMRDNYTNIYRGASKDSDKIQVFGLSVLSLDQRYYREYMLQHIFNDAIIKERIDVNDLDINRAENISNKIISILYTCTRLISPHVKFTLLHLPRVSPRLEFAHTKL